MPTATAPVPVGTVTVTLPAAPSPTPTPAASGVPADAIDYANPNGGFALKLPAGWVVVGPLATTANYQLYVLGPEAGLSGGPDVSQIIIADASQLTPEQFAQQQCGICAPNPSEATTLGGLPAQRLAIGGGPAPSFLWHFVTHHGQLIGFSIRGEGLEWVTQSVTFSAAPAQTYRNDRVGFTLTVPGDWHLTPTTPPAEPVAVDTVAYIFSQAPAAGAGEGPVEGLKIDVVVVYAPAGQTLAEAVAAQKANLAEGNGQLTGETALTLADGLPAVRLTTTSPRGEGVVLLAQVNQAIVLLGGTGTRLDLFDTVALSLRALPPTAATVACEAAYAADNALYCLNAAHTPALITTSAPGTQIGSPVVSADGARVAYLVFDAAGNSELWAVDVAAGAAPVFVASQTNVPHPDPQMINSPRTVHWLGATTALVFDTRFQPIGGIVALGDYNNSDLWRVEPGMAPLNLVPAGAGGDVYVSPDGSHIALSGPNMIQLLNADGNDRRGVLNYPLVATYSEYLYKPAVVWASDSRSFGVAVPSADPLAPDSNVRFVRVTAAGQSETRVILPGNFVFSGGPAAALAPDGEHALYGRTGADNLTELWLVAGDGSNPMVVARTDASANGWGWSPDSQHYVYGVVPVGGNFVVSAAGAVQPLAPEVTLVGLEWADASTFYFIGITGEAQYGVYVYTLGAPEAQLLVGGLGPGVVLDVR